MGKERAALPAVEKGQTVLERLWAELDTVMERLMWDWADPPESAEAINAHDLTTRKLDNWADSYRRWGEERGQAQGLAYAIAILENPTAPNVPGVKERSIARYLERHEDDEDDED